MSDPAAEEMESAKQAVSDARVLRNHGGSSDAIANRFLARAQTRREQAGYGHESVREDIEKLFDRTEGFLTTEQLL